MTVNTLMSRLVGRKSSRAIAGMVTTTNARAMCLNTQVEQVASCKTHVESCDGNPPPNANHNQWRKPGRLTARFSHTNHWGTNYWGTCHNEHVVERPAAIDPLALDRQVCFALVVAARSVVALYRPVLEPLGLTHPQYLVMLALWERSPRSLRDLSEVLRLDPGTLSPLVKRLERTGLVTRARDAKDERTLCLTLTDRGRALRAQAEKVPEQIVARLGLPVADLEHMHVVLSAVIAAAK